MRTKTVAFSAAKSSQEDAAMIANWARYYAGKGRRAAAIAAQERAAIAYRQARALAAYEQSCFMRGLDR